MSQPESADPTDEDRRSDHEKRLPQEVLDGIRRGIEDIENGNTADKSDLADALDS
jgi:hypothetical protein